jgi:adenylate kinase
VITGTPGTGKTTISTRLATRMYADYLSVTRLVCRYGLQTSFDRKRHSRVVDLTRARSKLRQLLQDRAGPAIVDTHVPDCLPRDLVRKVIVLRCDPRVLESRLQAKGWNASKVRENVLAELLDSCLMVAVGYYGMRRIFQLDTSRSSIRKSVSSVATALMRRTGRGAQIDWISTLEKQDRLTRHLM